MFAKSKPNFSPSDNQANEKLALYVYEYLMHSGARKAAQTFLQEIQWEKNIFLTDRPGFLFSWWSVFWDLYCAAPERRNGMPHSNEARAFHDFGFINPAYSSGAYQTSGFSSGTHQNGQLVQPYLRSGGGGVVSYLASGPQQQQSRPNGSVESLTQQSLNGGCQAGVIMDQRMPYGSSRLATPINQSETKTGMPMFFSNNGMPIHVPISQLEQVYTQGGNAGNQPNFYRNIPSLPISSTPSVTLRHQSMPNTQSPSTVFRPSARPQQVSRMPGGNLNDITLINARTNSIKPGIGTSVAFNYGASQQPQHMTINNYNLQSCNGGGGQSLNSSSSASSFSGSPNNNAEQLQLVAKQKEQIIQTHQAFQRSTQSKSARNVNIYNNLSSVPSQWVTLTQQQEMTKQQQFLDPSFTGAPTMRRENKMLSQSVQSTNNKSSGSLTPPGVDAFPLLFDGGDLNQTYEDDKLFTFYGNSGSNRDTESYVMVSVPNEDFLSNVSASNDLIFSMPSTVSSIEAFDTFPSLLSESMILPVNNFSGLPASSQIGQLLSMSPVPPNPSLHTPTPSVPNSVVYSDLTMHSASHSSVKNEPSQLDESTIMDDSCVDVTNANRKNVCNQSWSQPFRSEEDADTLNSISTGFANDDVNLKNSIFQLNDDEKTVQKMIDSLRENDLENSGLY